MPQTSQIANPTISLFAKFLTISISFSVSETYLLSVTISGTLKFFKLFMCARKFSRPSSTAFKFSSLSNFLSAPPWSLSAGIVATKTETDGFKEPSRQTMLKNFSAPRSLPKPASVIAKSLFDTAKFVAIRLLQPCAMFAKGPQWTTAGVFPIVWTRFG